MKQKILSLLFLLCASMLLSAQQKKYSFSLQEAVQFALDSSYTAQNANKEVAKALKQKWEATADGLPQIDGKIEYANQLNQRTSLLPISAFDNRQSTIETVEQFFDGPVRNGNQLQGASGFIPVEFGTSQSASIGATLTQLIFDGSYLVGLKAASAFIDYTQNQKEKQDLLIIEGVTNAYGSVLLSAESISVVKKNIETLEKNVNETQKIYENGLTDEENVEQLQITLLQLKNQLNNLKRIESVAKQMFNLSLGIPIATPITLTDSLKNAAAKKELSNTTQDSFNLNNNNDYKTSELLVEQRRLEWKLERSRILPSVAGFLDVGTQAFDNDFNFLKTSQPWFAYATVGGSINVPIFSSFKSGARIKRAKLSLEQAQISHSENKQRIELGYQQAKGNFKFAIDNLATFKQNLSLATRIEKKNQIKFKEGLTSSFELRQAQTQLFSTQQEYLNAQLEVIKSATALQTILNVYNR